MLLRECSLFMAGGGVGEIIGGVKKVLGMEMGGS